MPSGAHPQRRRQRLATSVPQDLPASPTPRKFNFFVTMALLLVLQLPCDSWHEAAFSRVTPKLWEASLEHVDARLAHVPAEDRKRCENVLRAAPQPGFAQAWQDWILYRNFFANQSEGLYLDIGSNEAITISNTAFFDVCLGWRGVCFEPQVRYHHDLVAERTCDLIPHCVLGRAANVTMTGKGGAREVVKGNIPRRGVEASTDACVGILHALDQLNLGGTPIDLMSIDIEGMEPDVLRCMPWKSLRVRFVLIETNKHDLRSVDAFFSAHGYANVATLFHGFGGQRYLPLDNLYARLPGGPLITPGSEHGHYKCTAEDTKFNHWCEQHSIWPADPKWGRCREAQ